MNKLDDEKGYVRSVIKEAEFDLWSKGKAYVFMDWQKDMIIEKYPFVTFKYIQEERTFYLFCENKNRKKIECKSQKPGVACKELKISSLYKKRNNSNVKKSLAKVQ